VFVVCHWRGQYRIADRSARRSKRPPVVPTAFSICDGYGLCVATALRLRAFGASLSVTKVSVTKGSVTKVGVTKVSVTTLA
jgi:hypothetical protein